MTTIVPFNPQPTAVFRFSPVLDGVTYSATVTWNIYGQRYYLNIYTVDGTLKLSIPLIASPNSGFVASTQEQTVSIETSANTVEGDFTFYPLTTVNVNDLVASMVLDGTGVQSQCLYVGYGTNPTGFYIQVSKAFTESVESNVLSLTFTQRTSLYVPAEDAAMSNINLTQGYFDTPIIYRASSKNFEIG